MSGYIEIDERMQAAMSERSRKALIDVFSDGFTAEKLNANQETVIVSLVAGVLVGLLDVISAAAPTADGEWCGKFLQNSAGHAATEWLGQREATKQ